MRKLTVRSERLAELTTRDLALVVAAGTVDTLAADCDAPTIREVVNCGMHHVSDVCTPSRPCLTGDACA